MQTSSLSFGRTLGLTLIVAACGASPARRAEASKGTTDSAPQQGSKPKASKQAPRRDATGFPRFHLLRKDLNEASGLVLSSTQKGGLWAHNDSGSGPWLYWIGPDRRLGLRVRVRGALSIDWEDMAIGALPGRGSWLFIADTGKNVPGLDRTRPSHVYAIPEPRLPDEAKGQAKAAEARSKRLPFFRSKRARRLVLRFTRKGPQPNVESLFFRSQGPALGFVTRDDDGNSKIYLARVPLDAKKTPKHDAELHPRLVARVSLSAAKARRARTITGAALHPDARTLLLLTPDRVVVVRLKAKETGAVPLLPILASLPLPKLEDPEGIAIVHEREALVVSEGVPASFVPLRLPDSLWKH